MRLKRLERNFPGLPDLPAIFGGKNLGTYGAVTKLQHGGRRSLNLGGETLAFYLKCMVVLGAQIRHHTKVDRELFLRTSDRSFRTRDIRHHVTMFIHQSSGTSVRGNRIIRHRARFL